MKLLDHIILIADAFEVILDISWKVAIIVIAYTALSY